MSMSVVTERPTRRTRPRSSWLSRCRESLRASVRPRARSAADGGRSFVCRARARYGCGGASGSSDGGTGARADRRHEWRMGLGSASSTDGDGDDDGASGSSACACAGDLSDRMEDAGLVSAVDAVERELRLPNENQELVRVTVVAEDGSADGAADADVDVEPSEHATHSLRRHVLRELPRGRYALLRGPLDDVEHAIVYRALRRAQLCPRRLVRAAVHGEQRAVHRGDDLVERDGAAEALRVLHRELVLEALQRQRVPVRRARRRQAVRRRRRRVARAEGERGVQDVVVLVLARRPPRHALARERAVVEQRALVQRAEAHLARVAQQLLLACARLALPGLALGAAALARLVLLAARGVLALLRGPGLGVARRAGVALPHARAGAEALVALDAGYAGALAGGALPAAAGVVLLEAEPAGGHEGAGEVLVPDGGDAGVVVAGDVDALELEEEDLGEVHVVEGVGDLHAVLEGAGRGRGALVVVHGEVWHGVRAGVGGRERPEGRGVGREGGEGAGISRAEREVSGGGGGGRRMWRGQRQGRQAGGRGDGVGHCVRGGGVASARVATGGWRRVLPRVLVWVRLLDERDGYSGVYGLLAGEGEGRDVGGAAAAGHREAQGRHTLRALSATLPAYAGHGAPPRPLMPCGAQTPISTPPAIAPSRLGLGTLLRTRPCASPGPSPHTGARISHALTRADPGQAPAIAAAAVGAQVAVDRSLGAHAARESRITPRKTDPPQVLLQRPTELCGHARAPGRPSCAWDLAACAPPVYPLRFSFTFSGGSPQAARPAHRTARPCFRWVHAAAAAAAALITSTSPGRRVRGSIGYRPGAATSAGTLRACVRREAGPHGPWDWLAAWGALGADDDGEASRFCGPRGLRARVYSIRIQATAYSVRISLRLLGDAADPANNTDGYRSEAGCGRVSNVLSSSSVAGAPYPTATLALHRKGAVPSAPRWTVSQRNCIDALCANATAPEGLARAGYRSGGHPGAARTTDKGHAAGFPERECMTHGPSAPARVGKSLGVEHARPSSDNTYVPVVADDDADDG
ncbi:hypothetical protein POSPLADRAFT_1068318 [Postia placenta MAD-698-R-SB12]|uniref:Uncharacterized protein n=1 Tax=Postia placenta MAD-698-R-SB12 TaxID=670580 RepID=A0A1X6NEE3_9APHY|nr:hypothetical protein POSPLADRAFT_1068318 [Postia placenta MAD-698-R-SB12]OSX67007.1 hypothetical protein POSPLADRAFT_1068318 [Postia placenta MAD-698-R-SB12]